MLAHPSFITPREAGAHQIHVQLPVRGAGKPSEVDFDSSAFELTAVLLARKLPTGEEITLDHLASFSAEELSAGVDWHARKLLHRMCVDSTATFVGIFAVLLFYNIDINCFD